MKTYEKKEGKRKRGILHKGVASLYSCIFQLSWSKTAHARLVSLVTSGSLGFASF